MPRTKALPEELTRRLAHRLTAVRRTGEDTDLPVCAVEGWPRALLGDCFVMRVSDLPSKPIDLTFEAVSLGEIVSEVELYVSTDPDSTRPLDASLVAELQLAKPDLLHTNEWEDYDEPLWDEAKSEVRLLVREYFEQADAHSR